MRVLIYFNPNDPNNFFEGARLRKTLKGECEEVGVPWVDDKNASAEIAHFISSQDLALLQKARKNGSKTVVSALYAEHDLDCAMLKYGKYKRMSLKNRDKTFLNSADLVLVPSPAAKTLLRNNGVNTKIVVLPSPVNTTRFDLTDLESKLFLRYYGVSPERKYVLIIGNFYERKKIELIRGLAKALPKVRFYFFGDTDAKDKWIIRHYKVRATPNLKFSKISGDDVYRSAMLHASAYLVLTPLPNQVTIMEAFAAKTPVISFGDQELNPILIDGISAHMVKTEAELIQKIDEVVEGKATDTTISAYAMASQRTLAKNGAMLVKEYQELLKPQVIEPEDKTKQKR